MCIAQFDVFLFCSKCLYNFSIVSLNYWLFGGWYLLSIYLGNIQRSFCYWFLCLSLRSKDFMLIIASLYCLVTWPCHPWDSWPKLREGEPLVQGHTAHPGLQGTRNSPAQSTALSCGLLSHLRVASWFLPKLIRQVQGTFDLITQPLFPAATAV